MCTEKIINPNTQVKNKQVGMYLSDMREREIFFLPLSGGASRDEIHSVTHVTLEELFRLQVCFRLLETLKGITDVYDKLFTRRFQSTRSIESHIREFVGVFS